MCLRAFVKFALEFEVRVLFEYELWRTCFPEDGRVVREKKEAVPVNAEISRFVNARRVMNTAFTKNHTASPIGDVL